MNVDQQRLNEKVKVAVTKVARKRRLSKKENLFIDRMTTAYKPCEGEVGRSQG